MPLISSFQRKPSQLALKQAKINVMLNYLVVGVTEEFQDFLSVLEKLLPDFFTGVLQLYKAPGEYISCFGWFSKPDWRRTRRLTKNELEKGKDSRRGRGWDNSIHFSCCSIFNQSVKYVGLETFRKKNIQLLYTMPFV